MPQNLGFDVELPLGFNDAVVRVKEALKQEGFGILTEIDLQAPSARSWVASSGKVSETEGFRAPWTVRPPLAAHRYSGPPSTRYSSSH